MRRLVDDKNAFVNGLEAGPPPGEDGAYARAMDGVLDQLGQSGAGDHAAESDIDRLGSGRQKCAKGGAGVET